MSKMLSVRIDDDTTQELESVCESLGCSKTTFAVEAIKWALEREREAASPPHTPAVIEEARMRVDSRGRVAMPRRSVIPSMIDAARR
jgi:hypothetical protein